MNNNEKHTSLPKMNVFRRFIAFSVALILVVISLSIRNSFVLHNATAVNSVDSLSGQRIGCCVGWETDYILTGRDDITLMRYDDNATAFVALSYNQIDAVGVDESTFAAINAVTSGLEVLPENLGRIGNTFLTSLEHQELCDEFDEWLEDFRSRPEYDDFVSRAMLEDATTYEIKDIPENENGKVLKVGYIPDGYPLAYLDSTTEKPQGAAIESIRQFAYDRGYTVEFEAVSSDSAGIMIIQNMIDLCVCGMTDVYRADYEGILLMTQSYLDNDVLLVKIADGQEFELKGVIEY